jgi:hypothetical protein
MVIAENDSSTNGVGSVIAIGARFASFGIMAGMDIGCMGIGCMGIGGQFVSIGVGATFAGNGGGCDRSITSCQPRSS